ncbi:hypothetical protein [Spongiimicrobium salis]|uniref:hypothetical protein n=1 Tax=Spongiimicrobium salis TaxID=1667022 RepID=UPI00374D9CA4
MDIQETAASLKYYTTCSDLPIWNFTKYVEKLDGRWLLREWNEIEKVNVSDCAVWPEIINEYYEILDDSDAYENFRLQGEIGALESKMYICSMIMDAILTNSMTEESRKEHFKELAAWGFAFNQSKVESELERFNVWLLSIKTKIGFIKNDLKKIQTGKKVKTRIEKAQVNLENATGRNNIDLKTTSVAKWIELIKSAEEMASQKRKNNRHVQ